MYEREFSQMIEVLRDHFPAECFALYRQLLLEMAEAGSGRRDYRQVAHQARYMQEILGQEEAFAEFMGEFVERHKRLPSLMDELGELAELGKQWRDRARRALFEKATPRQLQKMGIDELVELCPIGDDELRALPGSWQRHSAALVWAILMQSGGTMEAADITEAIVEHRGCKPQSAGSQRSSGVRLLEALDYVEVEREGNRLGTVRLVKR